MTQSLFDHGLVAIAAFCIAAFATPIVSIVVRKLGVLKQPGGRNVHVTPTPEFGGVAIFLAVLTAFFTARMLPTFEQMFTTTSEPEAIVLAASIIVWLGLIDDSMGMPAISKLAGQIVAASTLVVFGVSVHYVYVPFSDGYVLALSSDLSAAVTVVVVVAMINAINLVDGMDGLAAGIVCIGAASFYMWTELSVPQDSPYFQLIGASSLVLVAIVGSTIGFLLYNFAPASIFMGDTGAMLLGLLMGAAGVSAIGNMTQPTSADFVVSAIPALIPGFVLALPFIDTGLAILRRLIAGKPIFAADKQHLHHRLIGLGHSTRVTVLILWSWAALIAFFGIASQLFPSVNLVMGLVVCMASLITWTYWPRLHPKPIYPGE